MFWKFLQRVFTYQPPEVTVVTITDCDSAVVVYQRVFETTCSPTEVVYHVIKTSPRLDGLMDFDTVLIDFTGEAVSEGHRLTVSLITLEDYHGPTV